MKLSPPFEISPRLMAGVQIGGAWIQLVYCDGGRRGPDGRVRYRWVIDLPGRKRGVCGSDLGSGADGGTLQEGFGSLLSFLSACGESMYWASRRSNERRGENADLFPRAVGEWAAEHYEAIASVACEIEERAVVLIEEGV